MKKILITGGPVHAKIDAVKFVTNRFRGGRMADLATKMAKQSEVEVTYMCPKGSWWATPCEDVKLARHDGFHDYRQKVKEIAGHYDAVILGAAVANLIPVQYFKESHVDCYLGDVTLKPDNSVKMPMLGKFPSHNFKPGDRIFMEWQIAPRIVDEAKSCMGHGAHLFAFKLLRGVPHDELIAAAYDIVLESKATCVFANDADDLDQVYAVMKDRSVHHMWRDDMSQFINTLIRDEYYKTVVGVQSAPTLSVCQKIDKLVEQYRERFTEVESGYVFGTVAVRMGSGPAFVTTRRGKKELDGRVFVQSVNHGSRTIITSGDKATLNAPLLYRIFEENPNVDAIVHFHEQDFELEILPYAPPGTKRDVERPVATSFNIRNHGCFLLLDDEGMAL